MSTELRSDAVVSPPRASAAPAAAGLDWSAVLRRALMSLLTLVISAVVLLALWMIILRVLGISPYVGKGPIDVWEYFVSSPNATASRALMLQDLWVTLGDSAIGFVAGLVGAVVVAAVFTVMPPVEFACMPLAMLLRSVPLVAMAPLIGLIFGRGIGSAAAIGGVIVFFPALVNIVLGLKSAPQQSLDLISAYGGSKWVALRKVAIPGALPSLFASIRISVPGAVIGAMLYEWLFSARGLGAEIFRAQSSVQYVEVWAIVVIMTGASILMYTLVSILESVALVAWGAAPGEGS